MSYLTQAKIADDLDMLNRVTSAAAQEGITDAGIPPNAWASEWRNVWASAPGWAEAWESAEAGDNPEPGADPAVVTDAQILSQVQSMKPFTHIGGTTP